MSEIFRTVTIDDLEPSEMAQIFTSYTDQQQADFFKYVEFKTRDWPGTGWCFQAACIAEKMGDCGKSVVLKLADHINHLPSPNPRDDGEK